MRSLFRKTAIVLGALLCSGTLALAQGLGGAGAVQGTVKDATGGVLPGATVVVSNPVSGFKRDTVTDSQGQFVFREPAAEHLSRAGQSPRIPGARQRGGRPHRRADRSRQPDARSGGQHLGRCRGQIRAHRARSDRRIRTSIRA